MKKTIRTVWMITTALAVLLTVSGCESNQPAQGTVQESVTEQAAEQFTEQAAEQVAEQITEQAAEQFTEQITEQAAGQATEKIAETDEPAAEPMQKPAADLPKETRVGFYLDTVITLTAYTDKPELLTQGLEACGEYEKLLSRTIEGSDVWRINHAEGETVTVSPETAEILQAAIRISELSGGAFDVTIAPVSTLWDFTSGANTVPDAGTIAEAAEKVDYRKIRIDGNNVTLPAGMMIDLGGIAKGYIADAVKAKLEAAGISSAILSFGGNIVGIGEKPDGSAWRVGIQDIDEPTGTSMMVTFNYGGSTVTSGIYERGFEADGTYYHHILSSETGWPVQNELASVTIFSESSMLGDALATAAFALGTEKGGRLIENLDGIEALFVARDRSVTGTSGVGLYMTEGSEYTLLPAEPEETEAPAEKGLSEEPENTEETGETQETEGKLVLQIQVRETDPAPGYILVQGALMTGFLPLPSDGETTQVILQKMDDGTEWRNVIRMTPEGFSVTEADCEGHDCIAEGEVTLENMQDRLLWNMVICAPHQLTLSLYTPADAAAISRKWLGY